MKRYLVEASLPLAALGLKPAKGMKLRGDLGFISSDLIWVRFNTRSRKNSIFP